MKELLLGTTSVFFWHKVSKYFDPCYDQEFILFYLFYDHQYYVTIHNVQWVLAMVQ